MPTFRADLDRIQSYDPGKPIEEVSRELGITDIVKLASNESPQPPFPEVQEAIADYAGRVNRYPEDSGYYLIQQLSEHHGLPPERFWLGAGLTELLGCIALAVGGSGTSAVFGWPSFVMYPIVTAMAGSEAIRVPLDDQMRYDTEALANAVRPDTTVVYLCNPNNPTGTHVSAEAVDKLIAAIPERVLIVIDEAYHEFADARDYASAWPHALERDNVVVCRTFSKVYGLAGLRVGYMVGAPETFRQLRKTQVPFSVNGIAQAAATEALRHPDRVTERVADNAVARKQLLDGLTARGVPHADSQTNFVLMWPDGSPKELGREFQRRGVIVRPLSGHIRVTIGTEEENARFLEALDEILGRAE